MIMRQLVVMVCGLVFTAITLQGCGGDGGGGGDTCKFGFEYGNCPTACGIGCGSTTICSSSSGSFTENDDAAKTCCDALHSKIALLDTDFCKDGKIGKACGSHTPIGICPNKAEAQMIALETKKVSVEDIKKADKKEEEAEVAKEDLGSVMRTGHMDHADHADYGGTTMERTFTMYKSLPVGETALEAAGWTKHTSQGCNPQLGFAWTEDAAGATQSKPLKLYTTAGGQPAGAGTVILGHGKDPLPAEQKKWATAKPLVKFHSDVANGSKVAHVDVAFRSGDIVCSGAKDSLTIGDVLIVNPAGAPKGQDDVKMSLPLTDKEASANGWMRGSCFDGMGWHWFLDTSLGGNKLSWKAENLFPVVTMYHEGQLNAMFFASTINQVSVPFLNSNEWEPKSLSTSEMCANICDKDCTFSGLTNAGPFSTMHIYFRDHKSVTCNSNLKCGLTKPFRGNCCEADVVV